MAQDKSLGQRWEDQQRRWDAYQQPRWLWLWAAIASAVLTVSIGFTACGWTTRAAAVRMAAQAAGAARVELIANVCAARFADAYGFDMRLAELEQANELKRPAMLADEGWVTLAGMDEPSDAAARLCADKLANTRPPAKNAVTSAKDSSG